MYGYAVQLIIGVSMKASITIDTLGVQGVFNQVMGSIFSQCTSQAAAVKGGQNQGP